LSNALPPDSLAYALRASAALITGVLRNGESLNRALAAAPIASVAKPVVQDISFNTLREYGLLNAFLLRLCSRKLDAPVYGVCLAALYLLHHRAENDYVAVDQAVRALADFKGGAARGLVNAVLRNFLRQRDALLHSAELTDEARYSHPQWWVSNLRRTFPTDWEVILAAGNTAPPLCLRVNRRRASVDQYLRRLALAGIAANASGGVAVTLAKPRPVGDIPGFAEGHVSVQDAGAQRAVEYLQLDDRMRVLDACAAPGGKSGHILEQAVVDLLALDLDPQRVAMIHENLSRLGLGARCRVADAANVESWWDGRPFQRILLDAPCSASGVVRRHPDVKWLRRPSDLARFVAQQRRLLDALWRVLERGGTLLYTTCSVFAEENQHQVTRFVDQNHDAGRVALDGALEQQLLPCSEHDGFYYAALVKRG
jgi:16S rRNA (cytosine967-C5)-methyltransferase